MPLFHSGIFLFGYLMGSIPFGLVLSKIFGYGDIRKIGSGNIGATNVLRTGNKALAFLTVLLDAGKGALAIYIVYIAFPGPHYFWGPLLSSIVGIGAIIGHCYPVWLKFKGGKGVATTLGTLLAAFPIAGVVACLTWLAVAVIFKISSLAALTAMVSAPIVVFFVYGYKLAIVVVLISALVFWKHRANIRRLLKGEEPKISFKKKAVDAG